jgi:hypothetical protein
MKEKNNLIRVFNGTEITANLLKIELEQAGIAGIVRNDFNSGIAAGFSGGFSSSTDLYIQEADLKNAKPIIDEFIAINH